MKCSRQLVAVPKINVNDEHANVVEKKQETDIFTNTSTKIDSNCAALALFLWFELPMASCSVKCCTAAGENDTQILLLTYGQESFEARSRGMMNSCQGIRRNNSCMQTCGCELWQNLHSIDSENISSRM